MSNATGTPSRRPTSSATSVCAQPGLGVVVIFPRARSTGPNEPIPTASSGPSRSKNATAPAIVSAGLVVGTVEAAWTSSGPVPTAHSHLEPPASMPPSAVSSAVDGRR